MNRTTLRGRPRSLAWWCGAAQALDGLTLVCLLPAAGHPRRHFDQRQGIGWAACYPGCDGDGHLCGQYLTMPTVTR